MTTQINSNYLEKYAETFAQSVCDRFFKDRQFISGQEIIQLTPSTQVNFFIVKGLFELWQEELDKLKSSPFFDYRDIAVHEALTQFMNVLSRRIKVERNYLEAMLQEAVMEAVWVATDPLTYFQREVSKAPKGMINAFLKENKKYYKWNEKVVTTLIDKAGLGMDLGSFQLAIGSNYAALKDSLDPVSDLLASLNELVSFDLDTYLGQSPALEANTEKGEVFVAPAKEQAPELYNEEAEEEVDQGIEEDVPVQEKSAAPAPNTSEKGLNAPQLSALFATETYKGMKGILGELSESLSLNQRFMFTKELFDGNADLLRHALKSVDEVGSFEAAVDLINARFVFELAWDIESEEVREFMQQVYRKFVR